MGSRDAILIASSDRNRLHGWNIVPLKGFFSEKSEFVSGQRLGVTKPKMTHTPRLNVVTTT